jgi:hypothetical protein
MNPEIFQKIVENMAETGCPVPVLYGKERFRDTSYTSNRVVFFREGEWDHFEYPSQSRTNPRMIARRVVAVNCIVIACSSEPGARRVDHEILADKIVDSLIVAILQACSNNRVQFGSGGFPSAEALEIPGTEDMAGVMYGFSITIDRAVFDTDWAGNAREETTLGCIKTKVNVK